MQMGMTNRRSFSAVAAAAGVAAFALFAIPAAAADAEESETSIAEQALDPSLEGVVLMDPDPGVEEPVVVLLGGSEGGDRGARSLAPGFLEAGYAVVIYPYYDPLPWDGSRTEQTFPSLPAAFHDIPVDRLQLVFDRLPEMDGVDGERIGLYGVSKGAEFVLLAGQYLQGIDAIAAIVPTDVVWEGWGPKLKEGEPSSFSFEGEPLAFVPYDGLMEEFAAAQAEGRPLELRRPQDRGREANLERVPAARIHVEEIDLPLLVAGGDSDIVWASGEMAQAIAERRYEAGLETDVYLFPKAGHSLSGPPRPDADPDSAEEIARTTLWPATLAFFDKWLSRRNTASAR